MANSPQNNRIKKTVAGPQAALPSGPSKTTPLERVKQIVAGMARSEKDAYWLGVRMENFLRVYESRIDSVSTADACDYTSRGRE